MPKNNVTVLSSVPNASRLSDFWVTDLDIDVAGPDLDDGIDIIARARQAAEFGEEFSLTIPVDL